MKIKRLEHLTIAKEAQIFKKRSLRGHLVIVHRYLMGGYKEYGAMLFSVVPKARGNG